MQLTCGTEKFWKLEKFGIYIKLHHFYISFNFLLESPRDLDSLQNPIESQQPTGVADSIITSRD